MNRLIFDTHAHYTSHSFDDDRYELLSALPESGVALVMDCGTDYQSSLASLELSQKFEWVYSAVGIHPTSLIEEEASTLQVFKGDWHRELKEIATLLDNHKVAAIGEIGLDHHWPVPEEEQLLLFEAQLKIAIERKLPVIVHDREAHAEVYALLKKYRPRGVLHAYSGSAEDVKWLCAQGMYIGFTGVVTFKNARRPLEAAAAVPAEYLLLETDCPYMAPVPFRGKRCDSSMIAHSAEKIAEVRGVNGETLLCGCLKNGKRLFGIA